jgi:hypothetical protein
MRLAMVSHTIRVAALLSAAFGFSASPCLAQTTAASAPLRADAAARLQLENSVARLFEDTRRANGLPHLGRIKHRIALERLVCTASTSGKPVTLESQADSILYQTDNITASNPEFLRVAKYDDSHSKGEPKISRFAVAVWPVDGDSAKYWVGVSLYWGAANEYFEYHFTDSMFYKPDFSKVIAPSCANVQ